MGAMKKCERTKSLMLPLGLEDHEVEYDTVGATLTQIIPV